MFISQIKESEKQKAQAQVKQNAFDEWQQEAAKETCVHRVRQPPISILLCMTSLLNLQLH